MKALFRGRYRSMVTAKCHLRPDEDPTKQGLALTPSDIERLARQGVAISTPAADQFRYDNNTSWSMPPEYSRDSDRNSMWELSKSAKVRIVNARKRDNQKYT